MVAVDILTGYLGSGKTTLLRHVLGAGLDGRRVAIVINEVGEIGIDGTVIRGLSHVDQMVELANGCLCCTIDDYRFDRAMDELARTARPDLIVIESTGVADPGPLADRIRRIGFGLDAVITVVDAGDVERRLAEEPIVRAQIEAADFLVLNKVDLVGAERAASIGRRLARLNARAERSEAVRGAVDADLLFATGAARYRATAATAADADEAAPVDSFVYRTAHGLDIDRFERVLLDLPATVIRAKGLVRVAGRPARCLFNYTSGRHELSWVHLPGVTDTQAVFIGRGVRAHEGALRAALAWCESAAAPEQPRA